jgi:hypothetical protein
MRRVLLGPLPRVPTLVLSGDVDLRTPPADAVALARDAGRPAAAGARHGPRGPGRGPVRLRGPARRALPGRRFHTADGRHDLRIRGAAAGTLRVRGTGATRTLGGRRVVVRLDLRALGGGGVRVDRML